MLARATKCRTTAEETHNDTRPVRPGGIGVFSHFPIASTTGGLTPRGIGLTRLGESG